MAPMQHGAGVHFEAEAAAHAARSFINNMHDDMVFLEIDFLNAFNTVRRDCQAERFNNMPQKSIHSWNAVTKILHFCAIVTTLSFHAKVFSKVFRLHPLDSALLFLICPLTLLPNSNLATLMTYR